MNNAHEFKDMGKYYFYLKYFIIVITAKKSLDYSIQHNFIPSLT